MQYELISGKASHINQGSDYSHTVTPFNNAPVAVKLQLFSFRVNGVAVTFRTSLYPSIAEGDDVAVVGAMKDGAFRVVALRNLTTRADYYPPTGAMTFAGCIFVMVGIPAILLLGAGLILIGYGIWILMRASATRKAYRMLRGIEENNGVQAPVK